MNFALSILTSLSFVLGVTTVVNAAPAADRTVFPGLPSFPGFPGLPGTTSSKTSADGTTSTERFENESGARSYSVFVPTKLATHPGVLVVVHGCFMTGDQMATGTDMNAKAAERGFIVVYPEQTYQDNPWKCWNWFKPENQQRGAGELSIIAGLTREVVKKYNADPAHVIVTGISAGGAMASNLLGCYSDLYMGGLIESGLEFAAASTEDEAHSASSNGPKHDMDASAQLAYKCSPKRQALLPVVVVHGKGDPYVNPINGDRTATIFEKINVLIDAGKRSRMAVVTHEEKSVAAVGQKYGATYSDTLFDGRLVVRKIMVDSMGHGWSGGKPTVPYMEPRGVDASQVIVDTFFAN